MSTSTLVSIVPFPLREVKPGIYPGIFEVPAAKNNFPELLVIKDSIYHVEIDENRTITVTCQSENVARSVVNDYISSNLAFSVEDNSLPGLFWIPGEINVTDVMVKHTERLEQAKESQYNWFKKLVQLADDDWEKTRQHRFVSDMQRHAARALQLNRPWLINAAVPPPSEGTIKCVACQSVIPSTAIICAHCKCIINMDKWKELKFAEV